MRTNIDIDEKLVRKAMAVLKVNTKKEAVTKALEDVVSQAERIKRQQGILELAGKVEFDYGPRGRKPE